MVCGDEDEDGYNGWGEGGSTRTYSGSKVQVTSSKIGKLYSVKPQNNIEISTA